VSKEHTAFGAHIPALLKVAAEPRFASLRDDVYATVVDRYAAIPGRPIHTHLRDALVAAWRNPWLPLNDSAWGRVSSDARAMVAGWLKQHVIRQFFELLADDWRQDRSRFEFWSQYHERMHDVYIVLGSAAYYSNRPDLVKLRKVLDGRLLKLNASPDTINAFIMFIGKDVIVEFSQTANAAYRYDRHNAPVGRAERVFTVPQLKRKDIGTRMLHKGAHGLTWQQRFRRELGLGSDASPSPSHRSQYGAPADHVAAPRQTWQHRAQSARPSSSPATSPMPKTASPSLGDVAEFARKRSLKWENLRPRGGNVWVYAGGDDLAISRQLKAWGFAYKQGKGWWRA
ncbi:MAG TPA: EH signature domain-containing protein, partial [Hyphomicrobiaceae bacterium]|nr:EH signature domain-containing protein [Hyphomicrobiaceae bacterium]